MAWTRPFAALRLAHLVLLAGDLHYTYTYDQMPIRVRNLSWRRRLNLFRFCFAGLHGSRVADYVLYATGSERTIPL
jgi:hypothetical protein